MFEVVFETVWPLLQFECDFTKLTYLLHQNTEQLGNSAENNKFHAHIMRHVSASASTKERDLESFFWLHRGHNAFVRLLFRSSVPNLREHLCMLAGKLLQKKEVCNKAGTYASHRQRSDVLQEWCNCRRDFQIWCEQNALAVFEGLRQALMEDDWIFLLINHTAVPVSLAVIKPVDVPIETHIECPNCHTQYQTNKRQKVHDT